MIHVSYNHLTKSDFSHAWSSGSQRFKDEFSFIIWLCEQLDRGPVLITEYKPL